MGESKYLIRHNDGITTQKLFTKIRNIKIILNK